MKNRSVTLTGQMVGRTPWSARDALVPLPGQRYRHHAVRQQADGGVGRGPGGPPHHSPRVVFRPCPSGIEAPNRRKLSTPLTNAVSYWEEPLPPRNNAVGRRNRLPHQRQVILRQMNRQDRGGGFQLSLTAKGFAAGGRQDPGGMPVSRERFLAGFACIGGTGFYQASACQRPLAGVLFLSLSRSGLRSEPRP